MSVEKARFPNWVDLEANAPAYKKYPLIRSIKGSDLTAKETQKAKQIVMEAFGEALRKG